MGYDKSEDHKVLLSYRWNTDVVLLTVSRAKMTPGYFFYDIVGPINCNTTIVYSKQCFTLKVPESRGLSGHILIHTLYNYELLN